MTQVGHISFRILRKNHVASTTKLSFFRYTSKNNAKNKYSSQKGPNPYRIRAICIMWRVWSSNRTEPCGFCISRAERCGFGIMLTVLDGFGIIMAALCGIGTIMTAPYGLGIIMTAPCRFGIVTTCTVSLQPYDARTTLSTPTSTACWPV